jgi:hypothetical protein
VVDLWAWSEASTRLHHCTLAGGPGGTPRHVIVCGVAGVGHGSGAYTQY